MYTIIVNLSWILIVPIFALSFAVIWQALKHSSMFPEPTCYIIALSVSVIVIISMFSIGVGNINAPQELEQVRQTEKAPTESDHQEHQFIMLPYLALGLSILAMFIVLMLARAWTVLKGFFKPFRRIRRTDEGPDKTLSNRTHEETIYSKRNKR